MGNSTNSIIDDGYDTAENKIAIDEENRIIFELNKLVKKGLSVVSLKNCISITLSRAPIQEDVDKCINIVTNELEYYKDQQEKNVNFQILLKQFKLFRPDTTFFKHYFSNTLYQLIKEKGLNMIVCYTDESCDMKNLVKLSKGIEFSNVKMTGIAELSSSNMLLVQPKSHEAFCRINFECGNVKSSETFEENYKNFNKTGGQNFHINCKNDKAFRDILHDLIESITFGELTVNLSDEKVILKEF